MQRLQGRTQSQIEAQRKRVRFGKEEQQNERALTLKKSRSKRYDACSDVEVTPGFEFVWVVICLFSVRIFRLFSYQSRQMLGLIRIEFSLLILATKGKTKGKTFALTAVQKTLFPSLCQNRILRLSVAFCRSDMKSPNPILKNATQRIL